MSIDNDNDPVVVAVRESPDLTPRQSEAFVELYFALVPLAGDERATRLLNARQRGVGEHGAIRHLPSPP